VPAEESLEPKTSVPDVQDATWWLRQKSTSAAWTDEGDLRGLRNTMDEAWLRVCVRGAGPFRQRLTISDTVGREGSELR
jgi:hypothetical protein